MDPYRYRLSVWVSIASNRKSFVPSVKAILERYLAKISKGGQEDLEDCGLDMARTVTPAPGAAGPSALAVDGGA